MERYRAAREFVGFLGPMTKSTVVNDRLFRTTDNQGGSAKFVEVATLKDLFRGIKGCRYPRKCW